MFATQTNKKKAKTAAEVKPQRADAAMGKDSPEPNPVWRSLALSPLSIQPKLAISQPDDPYEREADHIADRVMRMATPPLSYKQLSFTSAPLKAQRKCASFEDEEESKLRRKEASERPLGLQMKSLEISNPSDADEKEADEVARKVMDGHSAEIHGTGGAVERKGKGFAEAAPEFQSRLESSKGSGQSLPRDVQVEMGGRMGTDFSDVRVHTGGFAHEMSASINAKAFTHGQDIYFRNGNYNRASASGKELLTHELVHTAQQHGLGRKIHRQHEARINRADDPQPSVKDDREPTEVVIRETNFSDKIFAPLLGGLYETINKSDYLKLSAKHSWSIFYYEGAEQRTDSSRPGSALTEEKGKGKKAGRSKLDLTPAEVGVVSVKGRLDQHFYDIAVKAFELAYKTGSVSLSDNENPGIKFEVDSKLEGLSATLQGSELLDPNIILAKLKIEAVYEVSKENIDLFGFIKKELSKKDHERILGGKLSIKGKLAISLSVELKPLHEYLKKIGAKALKESVKQEKIDKEREYKDKAKDSKTKKNEALKEKNSLNNEIKQQEDELKRLRKDKHLTPEEAEQKIKSLEKQIGERQGKADKYKDAWKKEKEAMEKAQSAANQEKKAAKKAGREMKEIDKEIRRLEEKPGRFKKIIGKFQEKIEKQRQRLDKISRRLAEKSAKWVEEKAVRWIGKKLAKKAAELVAKVILRAIPIIGELLLIWDAIELIWDIGSLLWNWLTGKEGDGDGEENGKGESGEGGQASDPSESSDRGTVESGTGTKTLDDVSGGAEKGGLGSGTTTTSTTDTTSSVSETKDITTTPGEDRPLIPPTDTTATVPGKTTIVSEVGQVLPYQEPSPNAVRPKVRHGAIGLERNKLVVRPNPYRFKLVVYYTDENGVAQTIQSQDEESFTYVTTENGKAIFTVETPFRIQTSTRIIFYSLNFPVAVHLK